MSETHFHRLLKAKITEAYNNRLESMASTRLEDYGAYREEIGYLQGLKAVLNLCEEIERENE